MAKSQTSRPKRAAGAAARATKVAKPNAAAASPKAIKPLQHTLMPAPQSRAEPLPRRALGRGLSSLIPPAAASTSTGSGYRTLPIERLRPNAGQPRKHFDAAKLAELTHSVRTQGVLQPIIVRKNGDDYEIVAGERRWRAASAAGLREVPTIVKDLSDIHALQVALIENIQRSDLDPLEEAQAYRGLIDEHALTHEALAEAVGKNRATISNSLRLLNLPEEVLGLLAAGKVSAAHVRPLLAISNAQTMVRLAQEFAGRKVSVREAEIMAKKALLETARKSRGGKSAEGSDGGADSPSLMHIIDQLRSHLKTKVKIEMKGKKGDIRIHFASLEALDDLLDQLLK